MHPADGVRADERDALLDRQPEPVREDVRDAVQAHRIVLIEVPLHLHAGLLPLE